MAGRIRVGAHEGERRTQLDYSSLSHRSEREIAAALGFGNSDEVVEIMRKVIPDACKPLELVAFPRFLENPVTRKALLAAEVISPPGPSPCSKSISLFSPYWSFLSDFAKTFPHSLDILTCPWGQLLRGGGKGDSFTWKYQQALDVVQFADDRTLHSIEDLERKHSAIFMQAYNCTIPQIGGIEMSRCCG